jgi:hypothetical protein
MKPQLPNILPLDENGRGVSGFYPISLGALPFSLGCLAIMIKQ